MAATAAAQAGLSVNSLRIGTHPDKVRMVLDLSQATEFRAFTLPSPSRLVIDLPQFEWRAGQVDPPAGSVIATIRNGVLQPGISRLVFEADASVIIKTAFILPRDGSLPDRLVIDFAREQGSFDAARHKSFGTLNINAPPPIRAAAATGTGAKAPPPAANPDTAYPVDQSGQTLQPPARKPVLQDASATTAGAGAVPPPPIPVRGHRPMVVIDAGHGGQDPGAIGAGKQREKDITLAAALELARQLEATGRYRVKLTRDKDIFIRLQDRVAIARKANADLFISLHADSIDKPGVNGVSVYTLSNTASDAQTARLAARENRADLIAGVDLSHEDKEVANILIDLAMRDTMNQSKFFANTLVAQKQSRKISLLTRPHRYAGFAVLRAADTPSVLIEMGFMSNRQEAAQLSTPAYRQRMAGAIVAGIDEYFARVQKNAGN